MEILLYNELDSKRIPNFAKFRAYIEQDDFRSADVKKVGRNLYRARLDRSNRLLFSLYRYQGTNYALILEFIENHAYDRSRFLQGSAVIEDGKIPDPVAPDPADAEPLIYLNPQRPTFNVLDKIISFDEAQQQIYLVPPPLIVIGSAGSGKTALTLEKMKQASGEILYVTRSPYLVHNSRNQYFAMAYANEHQEISFFSFEDYLGSIRIPHGKELPFPAFANWFARHRLSKELNDPYQIFEEFKGVLTGPLDSAYLSRDGYRQLGVKQSIFPTELRDQVYDLFEKYLAFMDQAGYYDANILSYQYLGEVEPRYDFIVIDEVQDLTTVQLQLILKSLRDPQQFLLCGDSNQIVHPNFFSWSKVKSLFYQSKGSGAPADLIRILNANYRNSPQVTEIANRVLKIKSSRFGSVDKESNYLVTSSNQTNGTVILLQADPKLLQELDRKTSRSTHFAVIVMHPEQKPEAKRHFRTPLIFSIQEAKGLEYENVILFNLVSSEQQRFRDITAGVSHEHLQSDRLQYARARDKTDKSLEIYKFHINALYVALTRAVKNIYLIEQQTEQPLFELLELTASDSGLDLQAYQSNLEEWRHEAHKLKMQGKQEQAEEICDQILRIKKVPWQVLQGDALTQLHHRAILENNKKAKLPLFEYALVYHHRGYLNDLVKAEFRPASNLENGVKQLNQKHYAIYTSKHTEGIARLIDQYGVDFRNEFNQTPLMIASRLGNAAAVEMLIDAGADLNLVNNAGLNAFQIALQQACADPVFAQKQLRPIYRLLEPDNFTIQTGNRLHQLDNSSMEFLMLNLMVALFYLRLGNKLQYGDAFTSADFAEVLTSFPKQIVPERRKKRSYLSSILSKNEVERDAPYNRKLFLRMKRGNYIINPKLGVRIEGDWRDLYDMLDIDMLSFTYLKLRPMAPNFDYDPNDYFSAQLDLFKRSLQQLRD